MQFTDREIFYTDRVCGSRSVQHSTDRKKDISLSQKEWNTLSPTNEMQFMDRELFYTGRI